jgi:putative endonuclease
MGHRYLAYILTNRDHTALYVGVTNDLVRRVHEHRTKTASSLTARYNVDKLVYFEETSDVVAGLHERSRSGMARARRRSQGSTP